MRMAIFLCLLFDRVLGEGNGTGTLSRYFNRMLYATGDNWGRLGIQSVVKMAVLKLKEDKKAAKTSFL